MEKQTFRPVLSEEPVLRDDTPMEYPHVAELLQNAPILKDECPAVPLVMEDV